MSVRTKKENRVSRQHDTDLNQLSTLLSQAAELSRDRTAAVVCASYVERNLGEHLMQFLPGLDKKLTKKLFGMQGVLHTISAKIDLALALGATNPETAANMRLIARIRDEFAHDLTVETFDDPGVASLVDKFKHEWDSVILGMPLEDRASRFRQMALTLCLGLHTAAQMRPLT